MALESWRFPRPCWTQGSSSSGNSNDAAQFGDPNSDPSVEGQRSDTIRVAHVEPDAQKTFVVSFPRDLIVDVPNVGRTRINAAYSNGGPTLLPGIPGNEDEASRSPNKVMSYISDKVEDRNDGSPLNDRCSPTSSRLYAVLN